MFANCVIWCQTLKMIVVADPWCAYHVHHTTQVFNRAAARGYDWWRYAKLVLIILSNFTDLLIRFSLMLEMCHIYVLLQHQDFDAFGGQL